MATKAKRKSITSKRRRPRHERAKPAEQARAFKELALPAELARAFKELAREARTPTPWMAGVKELDRALAGEIWGRRPERKGRRKVKRGRRVGARREYDTDGGITAVAEAVAERGDDD